MNDFNQAVFKANVQLYKMSCLYITLSYKENLLWDDYHLKAIFFAQMKENKII